MSENKILKKLGLMSLMTLGISTVALEGLAQNNPEPNSRFNFSFNIAVNQNFYTGEGLKYTLKRIGSLPTGLGLDASFVTSYQLRKSSGSSTLLNMGIGFSRFNGKLLGYSTIIGSNEVFVTTDIEKFNALIMPISVCYQFGSRGLDYFFNLGIENDFVLNSMSYSPVDHSRVYVPKVILEFGILPVFLSDNFSISIQLKHNMLRTRIPSFKDRLYSFGLGMSYRIGK